MIRIEIILLKQDELYEMTHIIDKILNVFSDIFQPIIELFS